MTINSLLNTGVNGMQTAQRKMVQAADDIVKAGTTERETSTLQDLAEPLITMKVEQHVFDASAKVIDVAQDSIGTLLDIKT